MAKLFPPEFADLEAVAGPWAIESDDERYPERLSRRIEELQFFYDAVLPRAKAILEYCDAFDIRDPPDEVRALLNVLCSLIAVSSVLAYGSSRECPTRAPLEACGSPFR